MDIYGCNQKTYGKCLLSSHTNNLFYEMINIILAKMVLCRKRKRYCIKCTEKEIEKSLQKGINSGASDVILILLIFMWYKQVLNDCLREVENILINIVWKALIQAHKRIH